MARKYDVEFYVRYIGTHADLKVSVTVNGKKIADCKTEKMAKKIIRGLKLVDEEERKRKEFRL